MYRYLLVTCFILFCAVSAFAQKPDTTSKAAKQASSKDTLIATRSDSIKARQFKPKHKAEPVYHPDSTHDPHKAVMRSLLVPGWGQLYNHRWWKLPIIYTGLGLLVDAVVFNNTNYKEFLALSKYREFGTTVTPNMPYYTQATEYADQSTQTLYDVEASYRRDRDLSILGIVGAWGIQAVDAYIDAKFIRSYSVDNFLSMKLSPGLLNQPTIALNSPGAYIPGLKLTFTLR